MTRINPSYSVVYTSVDKLTKVWQENTIFTFVLEDESFEYDDNPGHYKLLGPRRSRATGENF